MRWQRKNAKVDMPICKKTLNLSYSKYQIMSNYTVSVLNQDTICALASVPGTSAIAVVRISGNKAFEIAEVLFKPKKKDFNAKEVVSHTVHYGSIYVHNEWIDDVVTNFYRAPNSYTGEDIVEFFCHGSLYIQQKLLEALINSGCRLARPGEFTLKAFLNGKLDLSQAEAIADLIAANSKAAHDIAGKQLKGGFSQKIETLRQQLLKFTALIELELDFSEEDVEFADRKQLTELILNIQQELQSLSASFALGNVLKKGIPVAIIGKPNVGKSTLLNLLLQEDRAIVSAIPGTTRDAIEDTMTLEGITFRFIDTAGLRETSDAIESIGVEKTIEKIKQAYIVLYVFDISETSVEELNENLDALETYCDKEEQTLILVGNKSDKLVEIPHTFKKLVEMDTVFISAKRKENIELLTEKLLQTVNTKYQHVNGTVVSNARHYEALSKAGGIINDIIPLLETNTSHEFLATDLRRALMYLGEITGVQISNENVLDEIFEHFCIGK